MCLMLKKSSDRRQQEALEGAFKVSTFFSIPLKCQTWCLVHYYSKYVIFISQKLQKADINGDGVLSVDEYYRILKDHGIQCSRDEILQIIQIADKDHDG